MHAQSNEPSKQPWFHTTNIYQIYPRSFYDSNGDGIDGIFDTEISLEDLYKLLMRWYFFIHNNDEDLVDENGFSYFYDPLLTNMNYTFISNTDRQQRQYKLLKTRLDYLKTYE